MRFIVVFLSICCLFSITGCWEDDYSKPLKGVYRGSTKEICANDSLERFVEFEFLSKERIKLKVGNRTFYKDVAFDPVTVSAEDPGGSQEYITLEVRRWRVIEDDYRMVLIEQSPLNSDEEFLLIDFIDQKSFVVCLEGEPLTAIQLRKVD